MIKKLMFVGIILFSAQLMAIGDVSILVEPAVGYGIGTMERDDVDSMNGFTLGAKAGASMGIPFAGVDFLMDIGNQTYSTDGMDDDSVWLTGLGIFAGANVPTIPLRAWVGYYFMYNTSQDTLGGSSDITAMGDTINSITTKGSAFKIGAGYKVIPLVSVNFEVIMGSADEGTMDLKNAGESTDDIEDDKDGMNMYLLTVSIPYSLVL